MSFLLSLNALSFECLKVLLRRGQEKDHDDDDEEGVYLWGYIYRVVGMRTVARLYRVSNIYR